MGRPGALFARCRCFRPRHQRRHPHHAAHRPVLLQDAPRAESDRQLHLRALLKEVCRLVHPEDFQQQQRLRLHHVLQRTKGGRAPSRARRVLLQALLPNN
eukprot:4151458-Heterocapsa_arctica.AAC.1